jgi:hypothetical protein
MENEDLKAEVIHGTADIVCEMIKAGLIHTPSDVYESIERVQTALTEGIKPWE